MGCLIPTPESSYPGPSPPLPFSSCAQAFLTLHDEYVDAAIIDGANHFHILFQIAYPIARPLLLTAIVINFYWSWNAFLWPFLVIRSDELTTLPIVLSRYHAPPPGFFRASRVAAPKGLRLRPTRGSNAITAHPSNPPKSQFRQP